MKNTVFNLPKTNSITCIWIATGDPRKPLACVWTDAKSNALDNTHAVDVEGLRLCA